uniref:DUF4216 domain-containing protein n=1 Tax=Vitis vinifera TaxID=29760 RepID=A5B3H3_VITVI|nr:hypothetical protein VITISV_034823 [Vitis vinifera]
MSYGSAFESRRSSGDAREKCGSTSGPRQPGLGVKNIDVYLSPLVDDLKTLWEKGVETYDAHLREVFTLKAIILWTINDFPAYGNLAGCPVKGYYACPICGEGTCSKRLKHGRKNSYMGYRRFLPRKTKDGLNAQLDLVEMGLRSELFPKVDLKRTYLPPACYSLSRNEKKLVCQTLSNLKVEEAIHNEQNIPNTLRWLAHGPTQQVVKYLGYIINGCRYHTKERDMTCVTQNSGVSILVGTMQIASSKDNNPVFGELCFYGVINEIWDLDYNMFKIPIFKCDWVDNKNGIKVDELGFTLVDFSKIGHKSDPFILASQTNMEGLDDFTDNCMKHHPFISSMPEVESFDAMDESEAIYIREDYPEEEETPKVKHKGSTLKPEIAKNRSKGIKLKIEYNSLGSHIGKNSVELSSYLGTITRTHVPIIIESWKKVPKETKKKLWDLIMTSFNVNQNSKRNCFLLMGIRFRTFKYKLTKKYTLSFKNGPEKLKKPPSIYSFIQEDHWRQFVKDRLSEHFNLQAEGGIGRVDRSVLWKKAREKKGKFNKITEPVINMIDELLEKAKETGLPPLGPNDILCQALGKPDHPGRVVGQDRLVRPSSYFHQPFDDMKKIKEEIWEMVLDKGKKKIVKTPIVRKSKPQNHSVIKSFQKFVDSCLGDDKTYPIQLPISLFGVEFQTYIS